MNMQATESMGTPSQALSGPAMYCTVPLGSAELTSCQLLLITLPSSTRRNGHRLVPTHGNAIDSPVTLHTLKSTFEASLGINLGSVGARAPWLLL